MKTLTKHVSCECKFDGRKCNSNQKWNNDRCQCECKKYNIYKKDYIWNPATCSCKNDKYLASIIDTKIFYILLAILLIAIALLIVVSIYCYLIKYKSKQKHLLPY